MAEKEESQFLQELESRLDSLFGEDTKTVRKDAALTSEAEAESPDIMPHHEEPESEKTADTDMEGEVGREIASETPEQEPSAAAEIDRRFSEIFGDNHKTSPPIQKTPSPQALPFEPPPSFDRLKSIILSLEWEISLEVLEQMENEIDDVYPCLNNHPTAQGLLKILRFVGRYLRVWQEKSDQDSVHLLLSVFDQLENLIFSKWMTESEKHQCLTESIQHYRYWVERVELENPPEEYLAEPSDTITLPPQESPVPEETTQASEPESQEPELQAEPEPLLAEADQEPLPPEPEDEQPSLQEPDRIEPEPSDTITLPPQESPVPEETTQASEPESQEPEPLLAEADQEPLPPEPEDEQPFLQEPDRIEPEPSDTITLPPQESPVPEETTQASEPESQEPELQAEQKPLLAEADQEPLPPEPEDEQPSLQEPDRIEPEPSDTITLPPQESPVPEETTQASEPESQEPELQAEPEPLLAETDQEPLPPEPEDEQPSLQEQDRIEPEPSDTITLPPQESPVPEETTQASEPESEAQEEQLSEEQEPAPAETIDQDIAQTQRIAMNERALAQEDNAEHNKNDFMDLPSSESFTLALEEIKRNFQAEIDALKEEIRQLKNNR